MTVYIPR